MDFESIINSNISESLRLANDSRSGRFPDSEIIIDFKILVDQLLKRSCSFKMTQIEAKSIKIWLRYEFHRLEKIDEP